VLEKPDFKIDRQETATELIARTVKSGHHCRERVLMLMTVPPAGRALGNSSIFGSASPGLRPGKLPVKRIENLKFKGISDR